MTESTRLNDLAAALGDRYRVERELGAGGMATVYLAEDSKHHRQFAIKVLRAKVAAGVGAERFVREIRTTAQLVHPTPRGRIRRTAELAEAIATALHARFPATEGTRADRQPAMDVQTYNLCLLGRRAVAAERRSPLHTMNPGRSEVH